MSSPDLEIIDVTDGPSFGLLPPCADPRFDHRSCDYWENDLNGKKAARPSWWQARKPPPPPPPPGDNPFARNAPPADEFNPFAPPPAAGRRAEDIAAIADVNPFAPVPASDADIVPVDAPAKLRLLGRGRRVFGSYAKVLLLDGVPAAYTQFGPISAYPRAQQIRELYPRLPQAPLPAVITCIATTPSHRGEGLGQALIEAVAADLAGRGFAAAEAYPDLTLPTDETPAADPEFWRRCGFHVAADDERYPVLRMSLD